MFTTYWQFTWPVNLISLKNLAQLSASIDGHGDGGQVRSTPMVIRLRPQGRKMAKAITRYGRANIHTPTHPFTIRTM